MENNVKLMLVQQTMIWEYNYVYFLYIILYFKTYSFLNKSSPNNKKKTLRRTVKKIKIKNLLCPKRSRIIKVYSLLSFTFFFFIFLDSYFFLTLSYYKDTLFSLPLPSPLCYDLTIIKSDSHKKEE